MNPVIHGTFLHTPVFGQIHVFSAEIHVDDQGCIAKIVEKPFEKTNTFYLPGFIDAHLHAPQFKNLRLGLDLPLLEWLHKTTFPTESTMTKKDEAFYSHMVTELLRKGTTTACYFGTLGNEANEALVRAVNAGGQRAFVGKVCMDKHSPEYYCESTEDSVAHTKEFVQMVNQVRSDLIKPIVSPRFAISCSMSSMLSLGSYAKENDLSIQTHISENKDEVKFVHELYSADYPNVYQDAGLLTPKTLLAHGVHLNAKELQVIKDSECTLVHCPNSNYSLNSGIASVRQWLDKDINVALGTDVSGGSSPSMLNAMQMAIIASKSINFLQDPGLHALSVAEVLFLATVGGAKALHLPVGTFNVGMQFDALEVEYIPLFTKDEADPVQHYMNLFHGFFYNGDDRHIKRVFVKGKQVKL